MIARGQNFQAKNTIIGIGWIIIIFKNDLDSALIYLEKLDIDPEYYYNKACIYAKKRNFKITYEALNNILDPSSKAIVFAIMEEKDSMYHYMNKIRSFYNILFVNSVSEMDPYRNEPRFKAFQKKNYLPVTNKPD